MWCKIPLCSLDPDREEINSEFPQSLVPTRRFRVNSRPLALNTSDMSHFPEIKRWKSTWKKNGHTHLRGRTALEWVSTTRSNTCESPADSSIKLFQVKSFIQMDLRAFKSNVAWYSCGTLHQNRSSNEMPKDGLFITLNIMVCEALWFLAAAHITSWSLSHSWRPLQKAATAQCCHWEEWIWQSSYNRLALLGVLIFFLVLFQRSIHLDV